jgi:transcription antitermination factor NusG
VADQASTSWCVVRTQGGQTLTLAKSLQDAGFAAWTPTETVTRRARRSHPAQEIVLPLMPGLIFVAWDTLGELIALSRNAMPYLHYDPALRRHVTRGTAHFRIMQIGSPGDAMRYARVTDRELAGLRQAEARAQVAVKRKTLRKGTAVRLAEGAYEGLRGTVELVKGGYAHVLVNGWPMSVQVALHLVVEEVKG